MRVVDQKLWLLHHKAVNVLLDARRNGLIDNRLLKRVSEAIAPTNYRDATRTVPGDRLILDPNTSGDYPSLKDFLDSTGKYEGRGLSEMLLEIEVDKAIELAGMIRSVYML